MKGSTRAERPFPSSAELRFTDLRIDVAATAFRLRIRVFSEAASELPDISGENGTSREFAVSIGASVEPRAISSIVAYGNGLCSRSNANYVGAATWILSLEIQINRTNYFNGFHIKISTFTAGLKKGLDGPISIASHDDTARTVTFTSFLASEQTELDTICGSGLNIVAYEIYNPAGYYFVNISGIEYWSAANGRYEPSPVLLFGDRPVYRQIASQGTAIEVKGSFAGVYGITEYLFAGQPTYRLDGGGRFLRISQNGDYEAADELGGVSIGPVARSDMMPWNGFHILFYDTVTSLWMVRRFVNGSIDDIQGEDILRANLTAGAPGRSCIGCRSVGCWEPLGGTSMQLKSDGSWVKASRLRVSQQPVVILVDGGENVISLLDTAASAYSMSLSEPSLQSILIDTHNQGAQVSESFTINGARYTVLTQSTAGLPSKNLSYSEDKNLTAGVYSVESRIYRWSPENQRYLHIINNGNLRGNWGATACPFGWTCSGTVSGDFDRGVYVPVVSNIEPPQCIGRDSSTPWEDILGQTPGYLALLGASIDSESDATAKCTGPPGLVRMLLARKKIL